MAIYGLDEMHHIAYREMHQICMRITTRVELKLHLEVALFVNITMTS